MKTPRLLVASLVLLTFAVVAYAGPGPTSPLYLTFNSVHGYSNIIVVQGNTIINTFPEAYGAPYEIPIAVSGDVRTTGYEYPVQTGGQYTLAGTPTGTTYVLPSVLGPDGAYDSTSDGSHNYLVDYNNGTVYQTARDFTNPVALFTVNAYNAGITYDTVNHSLWISNWYNAVAVVDYSLNGTVLSSFDTGHYSNGALAFDPADHTLWLVNSDSGYLEQYSTGGSLLSIGPQVGYTHGGEFDLGGTPTPEPGTLVMLGSGVLGLAGLLRRKLNL